MKKWLPGIFLLALPIWLLGTISLSQLGLVNLSALTLGLGVNTIITIGLLFGLAYKRARFSVQLSRVYLSVFALALSSSLFLYAYFVGESNIIFYLRWILTFAGIAGVWLSLRRSAKG